MSPLSPAEKRKRKFSEDSQKDHDRLLDKKEIHQNDGDSGDNGDSSIVDRLVDSDFDSKVSVPKGVPTGGLGGAKQDDCGDDHPSQRGAVQPPDSLEKVVTSRAEKARLWDSIRSKLKKCARGDGKRRGLAVVDLQPDEVEAVKAAGWTQETTQTGISILWATEKSLAAMGLEAGA